jgi:hypothetical protein
MTHEEQIAALARSLIDDARLDREVLRRRWITPPWRDEVQRIAEVLEKHPLLISIVRQHMEAELARLATDAESSGTAVSSS